MITEFVTDAHGTGYHLSPPIEAYTYSGHRRNKVLEVRAGYDDVPGWRVVRLNLFRIASLKALLAVDAVLSPIAARQLAAVLMDAADAAESK